MKAPRPIQTTEARKGVARGAHVHVRDGRALRAAVHDAAGARVACGRKVEVDSLENVVHVHALATVAEDVDHGLVGGRLAAAAVAAAAAAAAAAKAGRGRCQHQHGPRRARRRDGPADEVVRKEAPGHDVDAVVGAGVVLLEHDRVGHQVATRRQHDGHARQRVAVGAVYAGLQQRRRVGRAGGVAAAVRDGVKPAGGGRRWRARRRRAVHHAGDGARVRAVRHLVLQVAVARPGAGVEREEEAARRRAAEGEALVRG